jgi:tRNA 2-thiouridine synthesizing protein A
MPDQVLDLKGLSCPLPILRTRKALKDLPSGATLQVLATDPGSVEDFEVYCRTSGNELVESKHEGDVFTFVIKHTA